MELFLLFTLRPKKLIGMSFENQYPNQYNIFHRRFWLEMYNQWKYQKFKYSSPKRIFLTTGVKFHV